MKGNPFSIMNSMSRFMDVANKAKQFQNNPSGIGKLLLDNGRINKDQYEAIKDMSSPSQIGNYLMNNGILGQQQVSNMAQAVPQVQQMMQ